MRKTKNKTMLTATIMSFTHWPFIWISVIGALPFIFKDSMFDPFAKWGQPDIDSEEFCADKKGYTIKTVTKKSSIKIASFFNHI